METIYDHGVTEQELTALFGPEDDRMDRADYAEWVGHDSACAHLFLLFRLRGDSAAARRALAEIRDPAYRAGVKTPYCRSSNTRETKVGPHTAKNQTTLNPVGSMPFAIG